MRRHRVNLLAGIATAVAAAACTPGAAAAPAGALDPTLGAGGFSMTPVGRWAAAVAAVVQPDGKIVTAGEANMPAGQTIVSTRLLPDGRPDTRYGRSGVATIDVGGAAGGNAIARQRDGKIVIAGTGRSRGKLAFTAARLDGAGRLDRSFGTGGIETIPVGSAAIANAVAIQPDGKIVLGGTATVAGAGGAQSNRATAVRLDPGGSPDKSFGRRGVATIGPPGAAWGLALQPDGRIVLAGQAKAPSTGNMLVDLLQSFTGRQAYLAVRLLPGGAPDPTFGRGGVTEIPIGSQSIGDAVALQPDGRIVIAGNAFTTTAVAATVRLLRDGSLDRGFGSGGVATVPLWQAINALTLQPDGKVLLAGTGAIAIRLEPDGSPDRAFGSGGLATARLGSDDAANGIVVQRNGRIVLVGAARVAGRLELSVIRLQG